LARDDREAGGSPPGPSSAATGNGAGAGPADPAITLFTESRGARVAIVISDRGIGIDPGDLSRLFDPYFTTKRGGTGLGLAIAKNIVEGLHGTISVRTVPGRGTDIEIDLPVAGDAAPVPCCRISAAPSSSPTTQRQSSRR